MQGKNKPSRRAAKRQQNIVEERKPAMLQRLKEQGLRAEREGQAKAAKAAAEAPPEGLPKALHRFYRK